jgi:type II secretory pathway pseudopilin PulG
MNSRRKGFTYAEVMVAALIMALLSGIGILLFQFAKRTEAKAENDNDAFRQGSQAVSRVRRELRGSEVLSPLTGISPEFTYRFPKLEDGNLVVSSIGQPEWEGKARIYLEGGNLMLEKPVGGTVSILARLQNGKFAVAADSDFFSFLVEVTRPGEKDPAFRRMFRKARL